MKHLAFLICLCAGGISAAQDAPKPDVAIEDTSPTLSEEARMRIISGIQAHSDALMRDLLTARASLKGLNESLTAQAETITRLVEDLGAERRAHGAAQAAAGKLQLDIDALAAAHQREKERADAATVREHQQRALAWKWRFFTLGLITIIAAYFIFRGALKAYFPFLSIL